MNTDFTSGLISFIARISGNIDRINPVKGTASFDLLQKHPQEKPAAHTDRLMRIVIMMEINYLVSQLNAISTTVSVNGGATKDKTQLTILILQLRLELMKLTLKLKAR